MNSTTNAMVGPLIDRAKALTDCNSNDGRAATKPPTVAAQSPLHELLIDEIAAAIPPAIVQKLRQATAVAPVHDWIAAAAMYDWLKSEGVLQQKFVEAIGDNPKDAVLALAKTLARTIEPPPPDARAILLDNCGALCEVALVSVILCMRAFFFYFLLTLASNSRPSFSIETIARQAWLPDILFAEASTVSIQALVTMASTCWLMLECRLIPGLLEFIRRLPLSYVKYHVFQGWQTDSVHSMWAVHALFVQLAMLVKYTVSVYTALPNICADTIVIAWTSTCFVTALLAFIAVAVRLNPFQCNE